MATANAGFGMRAEAHGRVDPDGLTLPRPGVCPWSKSACIRSCTASAASRGVRRPPSAPPEGEDYRDAVLAAALHDISGLVVTSLKVLIKMGRALARCG
jgi:hypothetical protein